MARPKALAEIPCPNCDLPMKLVRAVNGARYRCGNQNCGVIELQCHGHGRRILLDATIGGGEKI